jgi:hypothetical protein
MIDSIIRRKTTTLAQVSWCTGPWKHCTKTEDQVLYDHGFNLAVLLDTCSDLRGNTEAEFKELLNQLVNAMRLSIGINSALDRHGEVYLGHSKLPTQKNTEPTFPGHNESENQQDLRHLFPGHLSMTWLALKLCLANAGQTITTEARKVVSCLPSPAQPDLSDLYEQVHTFSNEALRNDIGQSILRSMSMLHNQQMGLFGASRAIFPLAIAMMHFRTSKPELTMCMRLIKQVSGAKEFRFAGGMRAEQMKTAL